jgi:hypothetical protein
VKRTIKRDDKFKYRGMDMVVTNVYENGDIEMISIKILNEMPELPPYRMEKEEFLRMVKKRYITFNV